MVWDRDLWERRCRCFAPAEFVPSTLAVSSRSPWWGEVLGWYGFWGSLFVFWVVEGEVDVEG